MWKICPRQPAVLFSVLFLLVAPLSCSLLTLHPQLRQIMLARFAIQIRKAQSKSATPPRGQHLSTICSSHSLAHHPKCKSCAFKTFAPLHLINATSCSIKQRDANPPSSSFQKKGFDNKLLWQCLATTLLPKLLTLHICFVHSPPPLPGINGQRTANTQALASSNFQFLRRVQN